MGQWGSGTDSGTRRTAFSGCVRMSSHETDNLCEDETKSEAGTAESTAGASLVETGHQTVR